eukprot:1030249-Pyramimonas_sp.AAC.1
MSSTVCNIGCATYVVQPAIKVVKFTLMNLKWSTSLLAQLIQPTHPKLGLQNTCGGDCEDCLALASTSLRPRKLARKTASQSGATSAAAVALTDMHYPE